MNKKDLISSISKKTNTSLDASTAALDAVLESIIEEIKRGGSVALAGFGSFSVKEHIARTGYNPSAKVLMTIPAKKVVRFKAGNKMEIEK